MLLIASAGVAPLSALNVLAQSSFGSAASIGVTAIKFTPLLITGLGVAIGIRAGLWNLGGEGQIYFGALGAALVALALPGLPGLPLILAAIGAGFLGGAVWMTVPAMLRAYRGVNELITTLLMNFVALGVVTALVQGPLGDPVASYPRTEVVPEQGWLPIIVDGTQMHAGVAIAFVLALVILLLFTRTSYGLDIRAIGQGNRAAQFTGVPVRRRTLEVLLGSGGLAGIAGAVEVLGVNHSLSQGFSPGYGFDAIAVALLGAVDPRGMIFAAGFFGMLRAGAPAMQRALDVPSSIVSATQGITIIAVVAGYGLRALVKRRLSTREV